MRTFPLLLAASLTALVLATAAGAGEAGKPRLKPSQCVTLLNVLKEAANLLNPNSTAPPVPTSAWAPVLASLPKPIKLDVNVVLTYWKNVGVLEVQIAGEPKMQQVAAVEQFIQTNDSAAYQRALAAVGTWLSSACARH